MLDSSKRANRADENPDIDDALRTLCETQPLNLLSAIMDKRMADTVGQPPEAKPTTQEQSLDFRGTKITLRSENGKPVYLKDNEGEWDTKDGELWVKRGNNGLVSWRGSVKIDKDGNLTETSTSYGVSTIKQKDGTSVSSIEFQPGKFIRHSTHADGSQNFETPAGKWTSTDGTAWKSGDKVFNGQLSIDSFGRYCHKATGTDRQVIGERSLQNRKILDKMNEIEKGYNVAFGAPNTNYIYNLADAETDSYIKVPTKFRFPTYDELEVIESSLKQFSTLAKPGEKMDFQGLQFNFVSASGEGHKVDLYGWYNSVLDGKSQIFFAPRNSLQPATAWEGLRGTALHEIGHHLQHKLWSKSGQRETPQGVLDAFGFKFDKESGKYRLEDKDGGMWERSEIRAKDKAGKWQYVGRWYPVVSDTVVKEDTRARTTLQMYESLPAERKPCTKYFTAPTEAHAEALSMYLFKPQMLHEQNPNLYKSTKSWDQTDINQRYGVKKDGVPNMMRGTDGMVVPNNDANRRKVQEMEDSWKKRVSLQESRDWINAIAARDRAPHIDLGIRYNERTSI